MFDPRNSHVRAPWLYKTVGWCYAIGTTKWVSTCSVHVPLLQRFQHIEATDLGLRGAQSTLVSEGGNTHVGHDRGYQHSMHESVRRAVYKVWRSSCSGWMPLNSMRGYGRPATPLSRPVIAVCLRQGWRQPADAPQAPIYRNLVLAAAVPILY